MSASPTPAQPGPATELLLAEELNLFLQEYEKNYKAGESKPREIGMPFLLRTHGSDTGVLLIHGLMAAPAEVREWAEFLHASAINASTRNLGVVSSGTIGIRTTRLAKKAPI